MSAVQEIKLEKVGERFPVPSLRFPQPMSPSLGWLGIPTPSHPLSQIHKRGKHFLTSTPLCTKPLEWAKSRLASTCSPHPFQDPYKCFLASNKAQETHWKVSAVWASSATACRQSHGSTFPSSHHPDSSQHWLLSGSWGSNICKRSKPHYMLSHHPVFVPVIPSALNDYQHPENS